ncbi:unnamed protein product [Caenorhabditis brenneri]
MIESVLGKEEDKMVKTTYPGDTSKNDPKGAATLEKFLGDTPDEKYMNPAAQVQYMATEFEENGGHVDLSWIQDNVMRNYHMAEIYEFYYEFRKFFEFREDGNGLDMRVPCNCAQQMCRPLTFEPRGETHFRLRRLGEDQEVGKEAPRMSRLEFEKWFQDQNNERYKKLQLTQEEVLMLDIEKLTVSNLAEQVTAQLQPYILPHFSRCGCSRNGPVANPPPTIREMLYLVIWVKINQLIIIKIM